MEPPSNYRDRIYGRYVTAHADLCTPRTLAELWSQILYFRKLVRDHFPGDRTASIVDLGCGCGRLVYALQQAGFSNVRGIDVSPEQIRIAKSLGISGVEQGDLLDVLAESPSESVDSVICFDVIEHFTKSELIEFTDSVRRILRPNGRWLIHVPNAESPLWGRVRYGDFTHEQAFTRQSLEQLLLSSGFRSVECFEDRPVVHGLKSALRALLWHAIRGVLLVYMAVENGTIDAKHILSQNMLAVATRS